MAITIAQINTAIADTLGEATGMARIMDAAKADPESGVTEGIHDLPAIQVYWQSIDTSAGSDTDRATFRAGVRVSRLVFHADVYARQRGQISENLAKALEMADAVQDVLEAQDEKPYFGLAGIQAYRWTAERVTFTYGETEYAGVRFVISVTVF